MTQGGLARGMQGGFLHGTRILLFVLIIVLIHLQYQQLIKERNQQPAAPIALDKLLQFFPEVTRQDDSLQNNGTRRVFDAEGQLLGTILQTSPESDQIIGFSGPTNVLIAFSPENRIIGFDILNSKDTKEHVAQVLRDERFMNSLNTLTWDQAASNSRVDAVSGATLTSLAIKEAIIHRLSGGEISLRFPDPPDLNDIKKLFPTADSIAQDKIYSSLWRVYAVDSKEIGSILRTSPAVDNLIGYQGPTETVIGINTEDRIVGITLGKSYDNEEYVSYVREDEYFLSLFNGLLLKELAALNLAEAEVEGVSGATMTSLAVAQSLLLAAEHHQRALKEQSKSVKTNSGLSSRDLGTFLVIVTGVVLALTRLRKYRWLRIAFQLVLIFYLGMINGDMISQAMLVGWAQHGVPWRSARGLVFLTLAAFAIPLTTKHNAYCTHLCPHGAAQQLLKRRLPWQWHLSSGSISLLKLIPVLLLVWCLVVAMAQLPFSLVDIEPFDAWVFRLAGWATLTIAIVGLVASLFVPMAYCRYGCPTGALLNYFRINAQSGRWSFRDWTAVALVLLAFGMYILN